jgi:PAS domain S-box-containing protein
MAEGVIAIDTTNKIRLFNPVAESLTGWPKEEALNRPLAEVLALIDEQTRAPLDNPVRKAIDARRSTSATDELTLISRCGRTIPVDECAAPIIDSFDRLLGGVLILRDVTDRRRQTDQIKKLNEQLDQRVQERTAALEVSNKELETFSYSVAHDLRAPLRSIHSFGQLLAERHAADLDQEGLSYLSRVRSAAERMSQLIDALLSLARIGKSEYRSETFNLSNVVRNVAEHVAEGYPSHPVDFVVADNMNCCGDLHMLRLAINNLLDNAWKFSCRTPHPRVEVGVQHHDGQSIYFVRDNGAGFDPQYADKLFDPFQRLHSEREFSGTGIGLAIVQRVIHRHSGRIWADSEPGLGATFFFTLRSADQPSR